MNNFKNLLIATLTGLLVLSLFTQPAQSATNAAEKAADKAAARAAETAAKSIEYQMCLVKAGGEGGSAGYKGASGPGALSALEQLTKFCSEFRP